MIAPSLRPFRTVLLPLQRRILRRRLGRVALEKLDGVPLLTLPDVFHPTIFRSSAFLVRTLDAFLRENRLPSLPSGASRTALDMGTGSGVGAIFAARQGFQVIAVDINPEAVRCAQINRLLHGFEATMDVREGDLFAPVGGEQFDLILFNPPFFRGTPRSLLDRAWRATDVLERFAEGLPSALKPNGCALVVLSTQGDLAGAVAALRANNLCLQTIASRDYGNEILRVYAVRLPAAV